MADPHSDQSAQHRSAHNVASVAARRLQDGKLLDRDALLQCSPRKRLSSDSVQLLDCSTRSSKRLRPNTHLNMQVPQHPDPLDADPFALMASQSHLLEGSQLPQMQRGNSSTVRNLECLPTPNIADLEVGLPEAAGSSGKADDIIDTSDHRQNKSANDDSPVQDQLQHLKKTFDAAKSQHRLQLQERNRQIGHLQEDREKLKRLLKKAEGDVRDAQDLVLCTVCQKNNRNCLILPCLHYLVCAGCLQQHTSTCPFCPACKTKVSGLLVVLTSI